MTLPLVSALMVTQAGRDASESLACFRAQTYPNKELVIVMQPDENPPSLGDLRNESVERAKGSLVIQWDDDDLCSPDRIQKHVDAMVDDVEASCCEQVMLRCICGHEVLSGHRLWEQTILVRREIAQRVPYEARARGEDTKFVNDILRRSWTIRPVTYNYVYRMHATNTCKPPHWDKLFRYSSDPNHHPSACHANVSQSS